jgi:hypothetical protein
MLLHIDGEIVEIRPGELFSSSGLVASRYLELLDSPKKPKRGPKPKKETVDDGSTEESRS